MPPTQLDLTTWLAAQWECHALFQLWAQNGDQSLMACSTALESHHAKGQNRARSLNLLQRKTMLLQTQVKPQVNHGLSSMVCLIP
ncbi:hypothetical protein NQZ68_002381 [Dissostichus eleginoides]|nr:hypothetical protein NQZ68_002381 [Dissostichus eleginoides]